MQSHAADQVGMLHRGARRRGCDRLRTCRRVSFALGLLTLLATATLRAQPEELGRPRRYLTDTASVLTTGDASAIESYLATIETELHVQFAVVLVSSVAPTTIEDYAVRLFERWGIGDAEKDEGLLLLVAVQERAVRFEVGYGLEGVLPDGRVGRIIRDAILPRFRAGDYGAGILDGLTEAARFVAADKGVAAPVPGSASRVRHTNENDNSPYRPLVLILLILVVFVLTSAANRQRGSGFRRRRGGGWNDPWYGGGIGWPRGGGGFGGGSSRGGGGFGGFGGGASGGGGATGRW